MKSILLFIYFSLSLCSIPLACSDAKKKYECEEVINGM